MPGWARGFVDTSDVVQDVSAAHDSADCGVRVGEQRRVQGLPPARGRCGAGRFKPPRCCWRSARCWPRRLPWRPAGWRSWFGNSAYAHIGVLPNPGNDAGDVGAALRRLGFEVTVARDAGADVALVF